MKVLNRDIIKYIAMFTMLLNHIANVFLERGTIIGEMFLDIGYFTAPCMCYFLVEGYYHTRSKGKYLGRLFLFAVLAQYPYYLALLKDSEYPLTLNMLFTLCLCFLLLEVRTAVRSETLKWCCYLVLIFASGYCDWPYMAAVYTLMFAAAYGSEAKLKRAFGFAALLFALWSYLANSISFPQGEAILLTVSAAFGVCAAGIVILYFYNGKRAERGGTFSKWFFYAFYPGHLLVLGMIRAGCFF